LSEAGALAAHGQRSRSRQIFKVKGKVNQYGIKLDEMGWVSLPVERPGSQDEGRTPTDAFDVVFHPSPPL